MHEVIGRRATGPWLRMKKAPPKQLVSLASGGSIGKAMIFNIFSFNILIKVLNKNDTLKLIHNVKFNNLCTRGLGKGCH